MMTLSVNANCKRGPMSADQRARLSVAQLAYVATDPRWTAHRLKLANAQIARRMTLSPDEFDAAARMRSRGWSWSYIQEEIGVCHDVIRREFAAKGILTGRIKRNPRASRLRGKGFWR
jgi:hypothetical protein